MFVAEKTHFRIWRYREVEVLYPTVIAHAILIAENVVCHFGSRAKEIALNMLWFLARCVSPRPQRDVLSRGR